MNDDFGLLNEKEQAFVDYYTEKVRKQERERIISVLQDYFDLIRFSVDVEGAEDNPEWDAGFQSALALIKGENE